MSREPKMPSAEELAGQNQQEGEEKLSPALQEVLNMPFNFDDEEYNKAARDERSDSLEVSEDALLKNMQLLIKDGPINPFSNYVTRMLNILQRDSMTGHPKMGTFKTVIEELSKKHGYKLKLDDNFWEERIGETDEK